MPQVPVQTPLQSLDVPGTSYTAPTATSQAVDRLGGIISNTGFSLAEEALKSEAVESSSRKALNAQYDTSDYITQLKTQYPTGNITDEWGEPVLKAGRQVTIADKYKEFSAKRFQEDQDGLGSELAQGLYRQKTSSMFYDTLSHMNNAVSDLKVQNFDVALSQDKDKGFNRLIETPDPVQARSMQKQLVGRIQEQSGILAIGPEKMQKLIDEVQTGVPNALLQGYESLATSAPKGPNGESARMAAVGKAMDILHGREDKHDDGMPNFSESMDPDNKSKWLEKFNTIANTAKKMDSSDWVRNVHNATEQAASEEGVTPKQLARLSNDGLILVKAGSVTLPDYIEKNAMLVTRMVAYPAINSTEFYFASPDGKDKKEKELIDTTTEMVSSQLSPEQRDEMRQTGYPAREWVRQEIKKIREKSDKRYRDDPVEFSEVDRSVKTNSEQMDFTNVLNLENPAKAKAFRDRSDQVDNVTYAYSGFTNTKIFKKDESAEIAAILTSTRSSVTDKSRLIKSIYAADPPRFMNALDQIITDNNLTPKHYMMGLMMRPEFSNQSDALMEGITAGKFPDADNILKNMGSSESTVRAQLIKAGGAYFSNLIKKSGSPINYAEQEAVTDTLFFMTMKKVVTGSTISDAVADTTNQFTKIKFNTDIKVGNGFWSDIPTVAPTYINGRAATDVEHANIARNLTTYLEQITDPNYLPDVPRDFPKALAPKWGDFLRNKSNLDVHFDDRKDVYVVSWKDTVNGGVHSLMKDGNLIEIPVAAAAQYHPENDTSYDKFKHGAAGKFIDIVKKGFQ